MLNSKTLLIFYPDRFLENHYSKYEIRYFEMYCNVVVIEFGRFLNKSFDDALHQARVCKSTNVIKVNTIKKIIKLLKSCKENTIIVDFIPNDSIKSVFINFLMIFFKVKTLKLVDNSNTLYSEKKMRDYRYKSLLNIKKIFRFLLRMFYKKISKKADYVMSIGNHNNISKGNCFYISSWEYSNSLTYSEVGNIKYKYAVLVDGAGPKFNDDSSQNKDMLKRYPLTSDKWYPSLLKFMEKIEKMHNLKFVIAAHPKSNYKNKSKEFGDRSIFYGKTKELIQGSNLIVTRGSTATIFAVIYNKPVFFIHNDQMLDYHHLQKSARWSQDIGGRVINIDNFSTNEVSDLSINNYKYTEYLDKIASVEDKNKPNWKIILHNIFEYSYDSIDI